ncbi:MAG: hypothetical protein AAF231_09765, partial [Pseudomonadota bacterium]
ETDPDVDALGARQAMFLELQRRTLKRRAPFGETITTLLGDDALLWLTAESRDALGKIQPHEFARTGWPRLSEIKTQLKIEQELLDPVGPVGPVGETPHLPKVLVIAAWTMAVMAGFLPPNLFLGEEASRIVSQRGGRFSVAHGRGSHTILGFDPDRAIPTLKIFLSALKAPELTAADMMWIALGLARIDTSKVLHDEGRKLNTPRFSVFLSHRGKDSKADLVTALGGDGADKQVFLDCLSLPKGVINRNFVFGSLCRSEKMLIVASDNYDGSPWCRKEAWLAREMARHGLLQLEDTDLAGANASLERLTAQEVTQDQVNLYEIAPRVHRDLDYWARGPNLHSLDDDGAAPDALAAFEDIHKTPDDTTPLTETVARLWNTAHLHDPTGTSADIWASAAQLAMVVMSARCHTQSKETARAAVDTLNALVASFFETGLAQHDHFQTAPDRYFALLVGTAVFEACDYAPHPLTLNDIADCLKGVALVRDGMILLDARSEGPTRDFHLRLAMLIMTSGIGSVGVIQSAEDEVHDLYLDDTPLAILPCITVHKGMEPWFLT